MANEKKLILISDFDGTVSKKDFFHMVIETFLSEKSLKPWNDYLEKKITHLEALTGIFSQIRVSREELDKFR